MKKRTYLALSIGITLSILGFAGPTVWAKVAFNTIDPVASVSDDGRHLVLTGPLACTAGERASIRVTITQRSSGAIAEGNTSFVCNGSQQGWQVDAAAHGREVFQAGPATAVAFAQTTIHGNNTDSHQWLVPITLFD